MSDAWKNSIAHAVAVLAAAGTVVGPLAGPARADDASTKAPGRPGADAPVDADKAKGREAAEKVVTLRAGVVEGAVMGADGKAPVAGARVALADEAGKVLSEVRTDKDGRFSLEAKSAGRHTIEIGKSVGTVVVDAKAGASRLTLLIPSSIALAVKPAAGEETVSLLGLEMPLEVGVGILLVGGALIVGGVGAGIYAYRENEQDDRDDRHSQSVSPTTP